MNRPISNPFATRFVAPGKLDWIAAGPESSPQALRLRLDTLRYRAAIVGPHGSGKSTLLEHLLPQIGPVVVRMDHRGEIVEQKDCQTHRGIVWLVVRRGTKPDFCRSAWRAGGILVLDGYEQLSYLGRFMIVVQTHWKRMGLVVTSHSRVCLPTLVTTFVTPSMMRQFVQQAAVHAGVVPDVVPGLERLQELLIRHNGNAREVMMQLFDEVGRESGHLANSNEQAGTAVELNK